MTKKILLINDMTGYGKVAISAMTPILVRQRMELFNLPTTIVSNTLNYGRFASIDTTEYMKEAVQIWKDLGFKFDAVATGFIANDAQADYILVLCKEQAEAGAMLFADPIMADNGKLYNSITKQRVEIMKKIVSIADYTVPNITEACFLSNTPYREDGFHIEELWEMTGLLHKIGAKSIIITGAKIIESDENVKAVVGYDNKTDNFFKVEYDEIPVKVNGSGDTFSAVVLAEVLKGTTLENAVEKAVAFVKRLISDNMDIVGEYNGLPIEASLQ